MGRSCRFRPGDIVQVPYTIDDVLTQCRGKIISRGQANKTWFIAFDDGDKTDIAEHLISFAQGAEGTSEDHGCASTNRERPSFRGKLNEKEAAGSVFDYEVDTDEQQCQSPLMESKRPDRKSVAERRFVSKIPKKIKSFQKQTALEGLKESLKNAL